MTPDSFAHALDHLDPGSRALLDLSLHRGLDDDEIADLLGSDAHYISTSREAAIAQIAADLGMHGDAGQVREALMEMPEGAWRPRSRENSGTAGQRDSGTEPEVRAELPPVVVARSRRRPVPRVALVVLVLVAAGVAIVLASGGGGSKSTSKKTAPPAASPAAPVKGGVALTSLSPSSPGKGAAHLSGGRLTLTVSGLPRPAGSYEVWLYDNEIDATPVTSFRSGNATVKAKLPESPVRYRYLDVSLEPADGNPNHSGQSLLRVPLRSLR